MNQYSKSISAAILAGGQNSRMSGFNKALTQVGGKTMLHSMHDVISKNFDHIILNCNIHYAEYEQYTQHIVHDILPGFGPLSGIHSVLSHCNTEWCFIFACDLPFLSHELIQKQIGFISDDYDVIVPMHENGIEPLHSIWSVECLGVLEDHLQQSCDLKITSFFKKIRTYYFDTKEDLCFLNINSKKDIENITKYL